MNILKSIFHLSSIRSKLIFWFLLISLLPLTWVTFISYESSKRTLINRAKRNLDVLTKRQAQAVENYFREKERATVSLAKEVILSNATQAFKSVLDKYGKDSKEYKSLYKKYFPRIILRAEMLNYSNIFLVSKEGEVVFSTHPSTLIGLNLNEEKTSDNSEIRKIFKSSVNLIETSASAFTSLNSQYATSSLIATPLLKNNILVGALVAQLDNSDIYNIITDYNGLGNTGETILISDGNNSFIAQSPLRKASRTSTIQIIPYESPFGIFLKQILEGKRIVQEVNDYNNDETLSAGRYLLPNLNWGIITKIDIKELLKPIQSLEMLFFIIAITTAIAVIIAATRIANAIAQPILKLTRKTKLMIAGDLSQLINIEGDDEISHLAKSFNEMASQLNDIIQHLDTIVAKRTEEVELQNIQLESIINELTQTQGRLINQEKLASLGALTAGIAHEIKNPLNFVTNFAELAIQIGKEITEEIDKIKLQIPPESLSAIEDHLKTLQLNISKIYKHGKRADSILRNMLDHSKGGSGEQVPYNINELLDEYIILSYHGMRAQDPLFNVKLVKEFDPTMPKILISLQEMSRVFLNLLNNAYYSVNQKKKSLGDSYAPLVRITTFYRNDLVIIKVWDNGEGIPANILPNLFTPFFSTKPIGKGTGLGLSLSYTIIVQGHHGTLTADSQFGEFAEFVITLPVKKGEKIGGFN